MILQQKNVTPERLAQERNDIVRRLNLDSLESALRFPKYFQIETSRLCNSRCTFCAIDQWDKSVPFMSDELFEKVAAEMNEHSDWIEFVSIQRAGEPLMDKKIAKRIERLKEAGVKTVSLSTNASLLNEEKAGALIEAGLDEIMFSIDSVVREKYESIRIGLDYDAVLSNIRTFFSLRAQHCPDMPVRVRGVTTFDPDSEEGKHELDEWESFWGELRKPQDRIYMKRAHNWGNQKTGDFIPETAECFHPCVLPWSTLHVTTSGKVPLCPQDYNAKADLGDVTQNTIADIWKNKHWERIRNQHATGSRNEIPFCRGCHLFDLEYSLEEHAADRGDD